MRHNNIDNASSCHKRCHDDRRVWGPTEAAECGEL